MTYATSTINGDFRIKVFGMNEGKKINTLVGVSGAIELIGEELFDKFICKAYDNGSDKQERKLRRGIKITFYAK